MIDSDLALLYGVETRVLVQAVKRNIARFPEDFMFQLFQEKFESWRSSTTKDSALARVQAVSQASALRCAALRCAACFPLRSKVGDPPQLNFCYPGPRRSGKGCRAQP
jgi:hypothetical protein